MIRKLITAAALALVAQSGQAQTFPAGQACADFDLQIESTPSSDRGVSKTFYDKNGNPVRLFMAGKGPTVTLTNLQTGATLSLKPNGAVTHVRLDDPVPTVSTWALNGHFILILFPTDVPAGPSTTLYVGQIVFTVDQSGVFTVLGTSGKSTDICAALSN